MSKSQKESLADYVKRVRTEKGLTTIEVEERSGKSITHGYVSQIENRYVLNVSPKKLHALARGLGVSDKEVFEIARGFSVDNSEIADIRLLSIFRKFQRVPADRKKYLYPALDVLEVWIDSFFDTVGGEAERVSATKVRLRKGAQANLNLEVRNSERSGEKKR